MAPSVGATSHSERAISGRSCSASGNPPSSASKRRVPVTISAPKAVSNSLSSFNIMGAAAEATRLERHQAWPNTNWPAETRRLLRSYVSLEVAAIGAKRSSRRHAVVEKGVCENHFCGTGRSQGVTALDTYQHGAPHCPDNRRKKLRFCGQLGLDLESRSPSQHLCQAFDFTGYWSGGNIANSHDSILVHFAGPFRSPTGRAIPPETGVDTAGICVSAAAPTASGGVAPKDLAIRFGMVCSEPALTREEIDRLVAVYLDDLAKRDQEFACQGPRRGVGLRRRRYGLGVSLRSDGACHRPRDPHRSPSIREHSAPGVQRISTHSSALLFSCDDASHQYAIRRAH